MNERKAFFQLVDNPVPCSADIFLSLYCSEPFYGGPEEGGWWGRDTRLVCYKRFPSEELSRLALHRVEDLAKSLTAKSDRRWQERCRAECDWLESRGLDDSFLPETSGPDSYSVTVESRPGSRESTGDRHYS